MQEIIIRPATLEDTEFLVAGNAAMALETEADALDIHTLRAGVCALFDDPHPVAPSRLPQLAGCLGRSK